MTDLMKSLNEKYDKMNAEIKSIQDKMTRESKTFIEQACESMFASCPEIDRIHWTQYSPYFNDGEECYFSVHDVNFVLKCDLDEDGDWEEGFYEGSKIYTKKDIESAEKDLANVNKFLEDPEAWRRERFGNEKYEDALAKKKQGGWNTNSYCLTASPYPDNVEDATRNLDKITRFVADMNGREDEVKAQVGAVIEFIHKIPDDVMESLFGNHVSVCITRDGMVIDEYEHD